MIEASSEPIIRAATAADGPGIVTLIEPFVRTGKLLPRTAEEVRDLVATGFVAEAAGRLVGFAALEVYSKKLAEIRSLAVLEHQQGHGLGSKLVQACVQLAASRGILEVMVITSAEEFFRSCGFDFTLPGEKKALFISPPAPPPPASSPPVSSRPGEPSPS